MQTAAVKGEGAQLLAHHLANKTPALSVRQPWAWAIIELGKDVENRTWSTDYRGPLLIHASIAEDQDGYDFLRHERDIILTRDGIQRGGIIGLVDLVNVVMKSTSPWAIPNQLAWLLANPRPLPFTRCRGRLGLFHPEVRA